LSRAARSVTTVVAALSLFFTGSAVAQANDLAQCQMFRACLFNDLGYSKLGRSMEFSVLEIAWPQNDQATSLKTNAMECNSRYYEHKDYAGRSIDFGHLQRLGSITADSDLRNGGGNGNYRTENWNDRISSVKFMNCS